MQLSQVLKVNIWHACMFPIIIRFFGSFLKVAIFLLISYVFSQNFPFLAFFISNFLMLQSLNARYPISRNLFITASNFSMLLVQNINWCVFWNICMISPVYFIYIYRIWTTEPAKIDEKTLPEERYQKKIAEDNISCGKKVI